MNQQLSVLLPKELVEQAKLMTGSDDANRAVQIMVERAAKTDPSPEVRALYAFEALRSDARRKHPNGMTQTEILKLIDEARRVRAESQRSD